MSEESSSTIYTNQIYGAMLAYDNGNGDYEVNRNEYGEEYIWYNGERVLLSEFEGR